MAREVIEEEQEDGVEESTVPLIFLPPSPPPALPPNPVDGQILTSLFKTPIWSFPAGDVVGTAQALVVSGLLGRPLSTTIPTDGQMLSWNVALGQWVPIPGIAGLFAADGPRRIIHARASGDDTNGDGKTQATAYRTFQKAIKDIPLFRDATIYVVQLANADGTNGIGTETLPNGFVLPLWRDRVGSTVTFPVSPIHPQFTNEGGINIFSPPLPIAVFTPMSTSVNPTNRFPTFTLTTPHAPGLWVGAFIYAGSGDQGEVYNDDGTHVSVSTFSGLTSGPYTVARPTAELVGGGGGLPEAITGNGIEPIMVWGGIKVRSTAGFQPGAFSLSSCRQFIFVLCELWDNVFLGSADTAVVQACWIKKNVGFPIMQIDNGTLSAFGCYFQGAIFTKSIDFSPDFALPGTLFSLVGCAMRAGSAPIGSTGAAFHLDSCLVSDNTGASVPGGVQFASDGNRIENTVIENNVGDAVVVVGGRAQLNNVVGAGNTGVGLRCMNAAQAHSNGTNTVVGTLGAVAVGSQPPVATWPVVAYDNNDFGGSGDGSRLFQDGTLFETTVLADSPFLAWPLDDAPRAQTIADLTGNGKTGLYVGINTIGYKQPPLISGSGKRRSISGSGIFQATDVVQMRYDTAGGNIPIGTTTPTNLFSLEWIARYDVMDGSSVNILGINTASAFTLKIVPNADGSINIRQGTSNVTTATGVAVAGQLAHWIYTYDGTSAQLYKNGALSFGPTVVDPTGPWSFGGQFNALVGAMQWLAIYNGVALSAGRVTAHAAFALTP